MKKKKCERATSSGNLESGIWWFQESEGEGRREHGVMPGDKGAAIKACGESWVGLG